MTAADPIAILAPLRDLAGWVARAGAEACVVAALVLLAQRLLRGRISARWSYNLWLLVLLRLVLPALPASRVSPFNLLPRLEPAKHAAVVTEPIRAGAVAADAIVEEVQPAPDASRRLADLLIEPAVPPVASPLPDAPTASGVRRFSEPDTTSREIPRDTPRDTGFPARASDDRGLETSDTFTQQPPTE